jgi:hypothetical protein
MLKAFEVMIENGQIKWLKEQPNVKSARAILTFLDEEPLAEEAKAEPDSEPKLEELGGSEPQLLDISRRRYDV